MRHLISGTALLLWAGALLAQSLPLPVTQALAAAQIPLSAVAVVVQPLEGQAPSISHNARAVMNPASVMKLVTTYAALELLGPAATWQTGVWSEASPTADGHLPGPLYLKGSGDPKFSQEHLWALLRQLQVRGIHHLDGDLVLDRKIFSVPAIDPGAFDDQPMRAYNVGPDGLLVDFRALRFTLQIDGNKVRLWSETPSAGLKVESRLTLSNGLCNGWRDQLDIRYKSEPGGGKLSISGPYPLACGEKTLFLAPLPADQHLSGLFRALWQELGGSFKGNVRSGITPPQAHLLASQESPPVADLVRDVNKWSNNVMARQIFLALGNGNGDGTGATEEKARRRVVEWLAGKGLDFPELVLENGSGLSRQERISADSLSRLLVAAWQSPVMPELMASLPITGLDGTMKKRLNGTQATGRGHIKTGSLEGVKTAAGYALDAQGKRHVVAFLINHPKAAAGQAAMDALLLWIAQGGASH